MARKLVDQLFSHSEDPVVKQRVWISLKSWKALVSRLNRLEAQVQECQKTTENLNQLVRQWLKEDKTRILNRENTLSAENALSVENTLSAEETPQQKLYPSAKDSVQEPNQQTLKPVNNAWSKETFWD